MFIASLFVLMFVQEIETPVTVNNVPLGTIEDYTVRGPAHVCLNDMRLDLEASETAYVQYLGIHNASMILEDAGGRYELATSSIFNDPAPPFDVIQQRREAMITRHGTGRRARYLYSAWSDHTGEYEPRIWLDDDEARQSRTALRIFAKLRFYSENPPDCDRSFAYGWSFIMGDLEEAEE